MLIYSFFCLILIICVSSNDDDHQLTNEMNIVEDNLFLKKIFDKYGDDGFISYEGFEHLLHNIGLGGNVFPHPHELNLHRVNGSFKPIHDENHRHKRHSLSPGEKVQITQCLSPQDLLQIYGLDSKPNTNKISHNTFLNLCPALVYQLDQKSCFKVDEVNRHDEDIYLKWIYTGLSVLLISAVGLLGIAVMPIVNSTMFNKLLHFLVALAIGTLCGDALLHLLPHALTEHSNSNDIHDHHTPIFKCGTTLLTILLFYSIESILRMITKNKRHGHSHQVQRNANRISRDSIELDIMLSKTQSVSEKSLTPVALMVILGDALHNITDGLAIGVAFSSDPVTGFATALAVFCHELPHELGDFAVLFRSGISLKKAVCFNILSSILSFGGAALGLWFAEDHENSSQWVYAATAGTFLYIALADLIPEINENSKNNLCEFLLAFIGIASGGGIMLSIALYEDSLKYIFS